MVVASQRLPWPPQKITEHNPGSTWAKEGKIRSTNKGPWWKRAGFFIPHREKKYVTTPREKKMKKKKTVILQCLLYQVFPKRKCPKAEDYCSNQVWNKAYFILAVVCGLSQTFPNSLLLSLLQVSQVSGNITEGERRQQVSQECSPKSIDRRQHVTSSSIIQWHKKYEWTTKHCRDHKKLQDPTDNSLKACY